MCDVVCERFTENIRVTASSGNLTYVRNAKVGGSIPLTSTSLWYCLLLGLIVPEIQLLFRF